MASVLDKWLDGIEEGWAIPAMLAIFVASWTLFLNIAYRGAGLHPDVIEAWTIGRTLEWGTEKHPPLMGWIAHAWTAVFPVSDLSFQLLAMVNAAVALWMIDCITRRFVRGDKRVIVLLLLMLLPVYQFQAQRFNANSVLFAVWPLAIYCFLRSFETRQIAWAAAAGLAAAVAVLGKYYSAFLIAAFVFAAICHPARRSYFMSSAPWVSTAAGILLLAPHVNWMARAGIGPFDYALAVHGGVTVGRSLQSSLGFLLGVIATLALPLIVWTAMIHSRIGQYFKDMKSPDSGLQLLLLIAIGAIVTPAVASLLLKSSLSPVWASPGLFAFVVVAVCIPTFPVDRRETRRLTAGILGVTILAIVVAPGHALYRNSHPYTEGRGSFHDATDELMRRWHQLTPEPLKIAGGDTLGMALAFYSPERPAFLYHYDIKTGWHLPPPATLQQGWAAMCLPNEAECIKWIKMTAATIPGVVQSDFVVHPRLWGRDGVSTQISAIMFPPAVPKPTLSGR